MRRASGRLLALGTVAMLLLAATPGVDSQGANRKPHVILGPDQVVGDSAATCAPAANPAVLDGCRRIDFNFNQTWDPDPQDTLTGPNAFTFTPAYTWTPASYACGFLAPAQAGATSPFKKVTDDDFPMGKYFTYAPAINDPRISWCDISITVRVDDGRGGVNCCNSSVIKVRVLNGNEPPRFDCAPAGTTCNAGALTVNGVTNARVNLVTQRGQDILFEARKVRDDRTVASIQVYLDLRGDEEQLLHRLVVPLRKCVSQSDSDYCRQAPFRNSILGFPEACQGAGCSPPQSGSEQATWRGSLPVNTRELITGTYQVWARALDTQGANATFPTELVTLEVEAEVGSCSAPCIFLNRNEPASGILGTCFAGEADEHLNVPPLPAARQTFALGHGDSLRPVIQGPFPEIEFNDSTLTPTQALGDPNLLIRKVTYQSCIEQEVQAGLCPGHPEATRCARYGPEVVLREPYHLSLDTLFLDVGCAQAIGCDQDVAIRAYDRLGLVNGTAFHLITDTSLPRFMIVGPPGNITYQGIPFKFNILVHDRIATEVTLHMSRFAGSEALSNVTDSRPPLPKSGNVPLNSQFFCSFLPTFGCVGNLTVTTLPTLGEAVRYDIGGPHDFSAPCQYLYDSTGDGNLDSVFNATTLAVDGRLILALTTSGEYFDYVFDKNGDGIISEGDVLVPGTPAGRPADAGKCRDAFASSAVRAFLNKEPTQVFSYTLRRNTLGETPYRVTIRDVVYNNEAATTHTFTYAGGNYTSSRLGRIVTVPAIVDASVSNLTASKGPLLPGDRVWINATVEQSSPQRPEPVSMLLFGLDRQARFGNETGFIDPDRFYGDCEPDFDLEQGQTAQPLLQTRTKCYVLLPPGNEWLAEMLAALGLGPPDDEGCANDANATKRFQVCVMRPDLRDRQLRLAYGPGRHTLVAQVMPISTVQDPDYTNNVATTELEVYVGRVIHGTADANGRAAGTSKEYHIRADARGLPLLTGGAVRLDAGGNVTATYDLKYRPETDRYEFTPDGGATLHWERQSRLKVDRSVCGFGENETADCLRPVTVIAVQKAPPETSKPTPGVGLVALIALGVAAALLRRGKTDNGADSR